MSPADVRRGVGVGRVGGNARDDYLRVESVIFDPKLVVRRSAAADARGSLLSFRWKGALSGE